MKFGNIQRVILFGGAPLLFATAQWLKNEKFETYIYTSRRHADEVINNHGTTLASALKNIDIDFVVTEDINSEPTLFKRVNQNTLGIGMGEAWSFNQDVIALFNGKLLDFMGIPHPEYRGGAHYTWMIAAGDRHGGCNLQEINADMIQGVFDSGKIIKSKTYEFPESARIPQDYFDYAVKIEVAFLQEFLSEVQCGYEFELQPIDEGKSLYFPRLHTASNGWIDWSWSGSEIERFICAFDSPYIGASTRINGGNLIRLKGAVFYPDNREYHSFQSGLVVRREEDNSTSIVVRSGILSVRTIFDEHGSVIQLRLGERLFTPQVDLHNAYTFGANYDVNGLTTKPLKRALKDLIFRGEKVHLRPLKVEDCNEKYLKWLRDPEVNQYLETRWVEQTLKTIQEFVQQMDADDLQFLFAIIENKSSRHIGNIKVGPINEHHSFADVSYFIGEKDVWGKGYATEAIMLATQIGFERLALHRMQAGIYGANGGSQRALEKAGYQLEGRLKGQLISCQGWDDHLIFGISSEDWRGIK